MMTQTLAPNASKPRLEQIEGEEFSGQLFEVRVAQKKGNGRRVTTNIIIAQDANQARDLAIERVSSGTEVEVTTLRAGAEYSGYICNSHVETVSEAQYKDTQERYAEAEPHVETVTA